MNQGQNFKKIDSAKSLKKSLKECISHTKGEIELNSTRLALMEAQEAFKGKAQHLGITTEQDIIDMVKQIRKE
jgi:hypothetical protein